ncbi:MAG: terminase gpA endonuclease subunit [Alphaproteobacteria bacterium]
MEATRPTVGETPRPTLAIVASALAASIRPPADDLPSAWIADNLILVDGPRAGERWSAEQTPFWIEVVDQLAPDSPANRVVVRKSAQVGFSIVAIGWLGFLADRSPGRTMLVQPTVDLAKTFNRSKLQPSINASPVLRRKVAPLKSRDAAGSSMFTKVFPGGSLVLVGANSSVGLRSQTVKFVFADEVDDYPLDLDGQGDPMGMIEARQMAFRAAGDWKRLEGSTPTEADLSRIDQAYEAGDQRVWEVPCPFCGVYQDLVFEQLRYNPAPPVAAHYECTACRELIAHHHKRAMVAAGRWCARNPAGGYPSYHVDTLISALVTWDDVAGMALEVEADPAKGKTFDNLWLGRSHKSAGDAPDAEKLLLYREAYPVGRLVPGLLYSVGSVDVQGNRLEWAIYGFDRRFGQWLLDGGVILGDPTTPEPWRELDDLIARPLRDAWGGLWPVEAWGIDAGYLSSHVYRFVGRHAASGRVFALDGREGWKMPALGLPSVKDITFEGRRVGAVKLWPVGTWDLKSEVYGALALTLAGFADDGRLAPGAFHLHEAIDKEWIEQATAERLVYRVVRGHHLPVWAKTQKRNEQLDLAVYARALAHHLSDSLTGADWLALEAARLKRPEDVQGDLGALWAPGLADAAPAAPEAAKAAPGEPGSPTRPANASPPAAAPGAAGGEVGGRKGAGWIAPRKDWFGRA